MKVKTVSSLLTCTERAPEVVWDPDDYAWPRRRTAHRRRPEVLDAHSDESVGDVDRLDNWVLDNNDYEPMGAGAWAVALVSSRVPG